MTIVNPLVSSNLVVQTSVTTTGPEARQNDLRTEQIVRATVIEGGLDRAQLELKNQKFWIQSDKELQTGQQLKLQVLTTHPKLTFKLLPAPLETQLVTLLPLLTKPFNWKSLLQQAQQKNSSHSEPMKQVLSRLSTFLRPTAELPKKDLATIVSTLNQLKNSEPLLSGANGPALATAFDRLLNAINLPGEALELTQQLKAVALQIRQQPELISAFSAAKREKFSEILNQISQPQKPLPVAQARLLATELKTLLPANPAQANNSMSHLDQVLQSLLTPSPEKIELSPVVLGLLKGLVNQLEIAVAAKPDWPQGLQLLIQQVLGSVQPLLTEPAVLEQGRNLGVLSQLFGLNLETELLRGRTKDALSSLKVALLGDRAELGPKGEEALQRLELFQICRVRLAEQNLTFIPLPLSFLEEGFLLVEEQEEQDPKKNKEDTNMRLTLYLKLSSLGNLRIDMLSESSGMLLRVACEDQERANFLQLMSDQLQGRVKELNIRGISFTTGVEAPACELLQRILPSTNRMLDARV